MNIKPPCNVIFVYKPQISRAKMERANIPFHRSWLSPLSGSQVGVRMGIPQFKNSAQITSQDSDSKSANTQVKASISGTSV